MFKKGRFISQGIKYLWNITCNRINILQVVKKMRNQPFDCRLYSYIKTAELLKKGAALQKGKKVKEMSAMMLMSINFFL